MKPIKPLQLWYLIKDYVTIAIGLSMYALAWTSFLLPIQVTTGGVTGISALIFYKTGIPIQISYSAINVVLLLLSIKILGLKFSLRTIYGVVVLAIFLTVFPYLITEPIITDEPFMSTIIGGMLCGAGVGLVFTSNGSTGGTDIVAAIINKYRNITFGRAMLYLDIMIILSSYFVFQELDKVVYGLVILAVMTYTVDLTINGVRQSVQFMIFSKEHDEIARRIVQDVRRGVTILDGTGWYSKQPVKVVVCLARRTEASKIFRLVKELDADAFISQSNVIGVYGKGFDKIKG